MEPLRAKLITKSLLTISLGLSCSAFATTSRPPQFVALAFDGSKSLNFWSESLEFAKRNNIRFTYFVSGVYFLKADRKHMYKGPRRGPGESDIGFGADRVDLLGRIERMNHSYLEDHEIASHANGHFDGSKWNAAEWDSEFNAFNNLIFNVFANNPGLVSGNPLPYRFDEKAIQGFRAPYLDVSEGLWTTLEKHRFRYDTSRTAAASYWPERMKGGFWNFPLGEIKIAGTAKRTLSMDYNFYLSQSGAKPDLQNGSKYEQQMYDSYMNYFKENYLGNRAPVHIGHHFSRWNGGAYWRALQRFAQDVCGKPEVRCVTYQELADFMDKTNAATRIDYQKGRFERFSAGGVEKSLVPSAASLDLAFSWNRINTNQIEVTLGGSSLPFVKSGTRISVESKSGFAKHFSPSERIILEAQNFEKGEFIKLSLLRGNDELLSSTREVLNEADFGVSTQDLEEEYLKGDWAEAHNEE